METPERLEQLCYDVVEQILNHLDVKSFLNLLESSEITRKRVKENNFKAKKLHFIMSKAGEISVYDEIKMVKKHGANVEEVIMDFKAFEGYGQDNVYNFTNIYQRTYLKILIEHCKKIKIMRMTEFDFPVKMLSFEKEMFNQLIELELKPHSSIFVIRFQLQNLFRELKNIKIIKIRNIRTTLGSMGFNMFESLPENTVEEIVYTSGDELEWTKVFEKQKNLKSLKSRMMLANAQANQKILGSLTKVDTIVDIKASRAVWEKFAKEKRLDELILRSFGLGRINAVLRAFNGKARIGTLVIIDYTKEKGTKSRVENEFLRLIKNLKMVETIERV